MDKCLYYRNESCMNQFRGCAYKCGIRCKSKGDVYKNLKANGRHKGGKSTQVYVSVLDKMDRF